jgi:thiamine-phosphate pyrophosphorylase
MDKNMKSYLITDPKYYSSDTQIFQNTLEDIFTSQAINYACFRDKISPNFEELAKVFCKTCKKHKIEKYFINTDFNLATKLSASGVHLTSTQFNKIQEAKQLGLEVIISTHNEKEIQQAIKNGADMITYSPIFHTPNKGEPKGIENLQEVSEKYSIPIIALGGIIDNTQIEIIKKQTQVFGFASIRYFCN